MFNYSDVNYFLICFHFLVWVTIERTFLQLLLHLCLRQWFPTELSRKVPLEGTRNAITFLKSPALQTLKNRTRSLYRFPSLFVRDNVRDLNIKMSNLQIKRPRMTVNWRTGSRKKPNPQIANKKPHKTRATCITVLLLYPMQIRLKKRTF